MLLQKGPFLSTALELKVNQILNSTQHNDALIDAHGPQEFSNLHPKHALSPSSSLTPQGLDIAMRADSFALPVRGSVKKVL